MDAIETPVVLTIFRRPETTKAVLERIAAVRPKRLLVVADGPRPDRSGEAALCQATRALVEKVDWHCEIQRDYAESNMGLRRRMASGLTWAFEQSEEAIILEDDCLPHPSFFYFCQELLGRYREDE